MDFFEKNEAGASRLFIFELIIKFGFTKKAKQGPAASSMSANTSAR